MSQPKLIKNGKPFIQETVNLINEAHEFILLHTYILAMDEVTGPIINALQKKAKEGVKTFLICDAIGSNQLSDDQIEVLRNYDFKFSFYRSLLQGNHIGRRLHQKVLLVDNKKAIIGGINLGKNMNLPEEGSPWLDYAVSLEGDICHNIFHKVYPLYKRLFPNYETYFYKVLRQSPKQKHENIKILVNDWMKGENQIYRSYIQAIRNAQDTITLMATYFVPGKKFLRELKRAKRRGVKVQLIFSSHSDLPIISKLEQYFYSWYLKNGFELYDWQGSIMHGKVAVIDNNWTTVGSFNHNFTSHYGNLEMNAEIKDPHFIESLQVELKQIIQNSEPILTPDYNYNNKFVNRFLTTLVYVISNIVMLFSMILLFQIEDDDYSM